MRTSVMKASVLLGLAFLTAVRAPGLQQGPAGEIPSHFGAVRGRVLDAAGHPVPHATVYATSAERPNERLGITYTDKEGNFFLKRLVPGANMLHASDAEAGYPDTYFAFFDGGPQATPRVRVQAGRVITGVLVRLGPAAGTLLGRVLDARNHRPVVNARITLTRLDGPDMHLSLGPEYPDATFRTLVPGAAFSIRVLAPGYEEWNSRGPVSVASRKTKEIVVLLRPTGKRQE